MSERSQERGFLNRWSNRKKQVDQQQETLLDTDSQQPEIENTQLHSDSFDARTSEHSVDQNGVAGEPDSEPVTDAENTAEVLLCDDDMPPIESLSADSDLSGFMNKGVSAVLRKAALRHVFQQAKYNVRDGLNDYDGDYTAFEPLGDTVTSDMKWHIARKERERLEAEALAEEQRFEQEALQSETQTQDEEPEDRDENRLVEEDEANEPQELAQAEQDNDAQRKEDVKSVEGEQLDDAEPLNTIGLSADPARKHADAQQARLYDSSEQIATSPDRIGKLLRVNTHTVKDPIE